MATYKIRARTGAVKAVLILAANAVVVALVSTLVTALTGVDAFHPAGGSNAWATVVGWLHVVFGATALAMRASARFLSDAEEANDLRREGRALLLGAGALIAAGSSLILLAFSGSGSAVPPSTMLKIVLALNALAWLFVWLRLGQLDELNRAVARDAGYLTITWLSLVGGTWAIVARLGLATAPAPLDWLTMIGGFGFVAGLAALGRRGGFDTPR